MKEETMQSRGTWNDWKDIPAGHGQALAVMTALRNHTDGFRNELTTARKKCEDAITTSGQLYETIVGSAELQFKEEKQKLSEECRANITQTQERKRVTQNVVDACEGFISGLPKDAKESIAAARSTLHTLQTMKQDVHKAINAKVEAYRKLHDCELAESERRRNEKIDKEKSAQLNRDKHSEQKYEAAHTEICNEYRLDIEKGFNKNTVHAYQQEIRSSRFNAMNYECPDEIPEYIMLGDIGLIVPNVSADDKTVVQAIDLQADDIGKGNGNEYVVEIPYAQRLSDGISMLMRYAPDQRDYAQRFMQPMLLKLFMSFPAGKLEATMIDPLELGGSFPDIPRLAEAPNSARIIDTKIFLFH